MSESILKWCDIFLLYIILHFSCLKIETSSFCPFSCFILLSHSSPSLPPCLNLSPTQGYVSSVLQSSSGERPSSGVSSMSSSISSRGQTRAHHAHLHMHANTHAHMHACIHTRTHHIQFRTLLIALVLCISQPTVLSNFSLFQHCNINFHCKTCTHTDNSSKQTVSCISVAKDCIMCYSIDVRLFPLNTWSKGV